MLLTNKWQKVDGYWYYFGKDSMPVHGWQKIGGKTYVFGHDGRLYE